MEFNADDRVILTQPLLRDGEVLEQAGCFGTVVALGAKGTTLVPVVFDGEPAYAWWWVEAAQLARAPEGL